MVVVVIVPAPERPIAELFAYVAVDPDGNEGICGYTLMGQNFPLVFGYERVALKCQEIAETLARETGKTIRLVKFSQREEIRTITGGAHGG